MSARRVFLDSDVLIRAAGGIVGPGLLHMLAAADTQVTFLASYLTWLEVLPKPTYNKFPEQRKFLELHRDRSEHVRIDDAMLAYALQLAVKYGLGGADGVHVACAQVAKADLFVTNERAHSPLHRVKAVRVIHVDAVDQLVP